MVLPEKFEQRSEEKRGLKRTYREPHVGDGGSKDNRDRLDSALLMETMAEKLKDIATGLEQKAHKQEENAVTVPHLAPLSLHNSTAFIMCFDVDPYDYTV